MRTIQEPAKNTPIALETDVLVVGGGPAGVTAAVAARRLGMEVVLVEREGFLGGTLTVATLGNICGLYTVREEEVIPVVQGLGAEIVERLQQKGGGSLPRRWKGTATVAFDPLSMKLVCDELAQKAGVKLLFHTLAVGVVKEGDELKGILVETKQGRLALMASVIIDASGDGDVAAQAGVPFALADSHQLQFPSLTFRWSNVDENIYKSVTREQLSECLERAVEAGLDLPRVHGTGHITPRPGEVHCNVTRIGKNSKPINPLDIWDLSYAEVEGRRQVLHYQEAFRKFVPGFAHAYVNDTGALVGIRESRLIKGEYTLQEDDVLNCRKFRDGIACSAWPMEIHGGDRGTQWIWLPQGDYYHVPLRTIMPQNIENLLVAGRCVSAVHEAQASVRVAGVAMAMGQAAGTAAAIAIRKGIKVRKVDFGKIQAQLLRDGALLGVITE